MVNVFRMIPSLKKIMVMVFWMAVSAATVIIVDSFFDIPDEISGVAYFISIGVVASATLNYYK